MKVVTECDGYETKDFSCVPYLEATGVWNEDRGELTIFAVNRPSSEQIELTSWLEGFGGYTLKEHIVMAGYGIKDCNTAKHPDFVIPRNNGVSREGDGIESVLEPHSWNVIRLEAVNQVGEK